MKASQWKMKFVEFLASEEHVFERLLLQSYALARPFSLLSAQNFVFFPFLMTLLTLSIDKQDIVYMTAIYCRVVRYCVFQRIKNAGKWFYCEADLLLRLSTTNKNLMSNYNNSNNIPRKYVQYEIAELKHLKHWISLVYGHLKEAILI